jgi:hypothetical protein
MHCTVPIHLPHAAPNYYTPLFLSTNFTPLNTMIPHLHSQAMSYHTSSHPSYISAPSQALKKRKHDDSDDQPLEPLFHPKKQRQDVITNDDPTSPPNAFSRLTPPISEAGAPEISSPVPLLNRMTINLHGQAPSTAALDVIDLGRRQEPKSSHPSHDIQEVLSPQNVFLRELHLNSRLHHNKGTQFHHVDEDMWRDEEEVVMERYAQMNSILGGRREAW